MKCIDNVVNWVSSVGFKMHEVMTGFHCFEPEFAERYNLSTEERFMEFVIDWGPDNLANWLNPTNSGFMKHPLQGKMTIAGLCFEAPCQGMMKLNYFSDQTLCYDISFETRGNNFLYLGTKRDVKLWKPWKLHKTHLECYGFLIDQDCGKVISTSTTYFDLKEIPAFVNSLRLKKVL